MLFNVDNVDNVGISVCAAKRMGCYTTWWRKTGGGEPPPPSKKISFTGHRDIDESSFRTAVANTLSKIKAKYPDALINVGGAIGTDAKTKSCVAFCMVAGEDLTPQPPAPSPLSTWWRGG